MLTKPCRKPTAKLKTFDRFCIICNGIKGYLARRRSLKMNRIDIRQPKIIRQITLGESHGKVVPPKLRPNSSITVSPIIEALPYQSIARIPSWSLVRGLWTSRKSSKSKKASPEKGRLIQKIHRQEDNCASTPPRMGPIPPAIAQMHSHNPRKRLRLLPQRQRPQTSTLNELLNTPHTENIRNYDIDKLQKPPTSRALERAPYNQYLHALRQSTEDRRAEEHGHCNQQHRSSAPNIGQLSP